MSPLLVIAFDRETAAEVGVVRHFLVTGVGIDFLDKLEQAWSLTKAAVAL